MESLFIISIWPYVNSSSLRKRSQLDLLLILLMFLFLSDKREDKRNGSGSKSSRKKSPDKEKERSKSKEKALKSESSEYDPGTVDKVSFIYELNKKQNIFLLQLFLHLF